MQPSHCVTSSLCVPGSPCHWAAYGFLAILLLARTACAQESRIGPGGTSVDCTNADLGSTLYVFRAPDHIKVIAVDYRNIKTIACVLRPDGGPQQGPLLTLEPGATAHTSFRWSTVPTTQEVKCQDLNFRTISVNRSPNGLLIVSRAMLPRICGIVRCDPYFAGVFAPDWPAKQGQQFVKSRVTLSAPASSFSADRCHMMRCVCPGNRCRTGEGNEYCCEKQKVSLVSHCSFSHGWFFSGIRGSVTPETQAGWISRRVHVHEVSS